uniref:LipD protein n=1 Tax=Alvinella pompejana epibiont 7G3 TaxID=244800 RepID=Q6W3J9_9BACT|nr:LipD protein [Alvinella pompejana epibiont 7G3]
MVIKRAIIIFLLLLLSLKATDRGIENLSLDEALGIMQQNNLELKISKFTEQIKEYEAKIARGHKLGKADVIVEDAYSNDAGNVFGFKLKSREATFGDFGAEEFMNNMALAQQGDMAAAGRMYSDPPNRLNNPDARNHFQTTFKYMVPLYTGGKLKEYQKITDALHRMSQLDTKKLLNEKIFQVKKTFYDISLVEEYISNLSQIIANIDRLDEIVASMREEGYAKEIDQLEVQARRAEAQSMLSQAGFNKELAYQYLSFLLNQDVASIQPIYKAPMVPQIEKDRVSSTNLDIQKAQLGLQITDMAINVQKSNFLPEVGAMAEYGSSDNTPLNKFFDKDFYTVGVQAKWNLFDGKIKDNNLQKAKIENLKVQEQVNLAKEGIYLKVKKTLTQIKSKEADVASLEKQLEFAHRVYETYEEQYKEGIKSISDVLIKQSKELEVLLKLLTAKNNRNTKVFELENIINERGEEI